jgi:hypothetical protein
VVAFIGHGFRDGEGREELSILPREPAKATCRQRKSPQIARPAPRRAEPLSYDGKWRTRGARRRGGFASSGPGRGRGKGGQTRKWAPGSAVEPTGHPFKHALKVEDDRNVVPDVELLDDSGGAGGMTTLGAPSEEADESEDEQGNGPW